VEVLETLWKPNKDFEILDSSSRTPKLLDGLKCEFKVKIAEKKKLGHTPWLIVLWG
jgi:hypothetical protein